DAELDRWSDAIAARVEAAGGGAEQRVAVCVERSPALVAALLGVLKTGAACLPIDPAAPDDLVRFVLEDAAPVAIVAPPERRAWPGPVVEPADDGGSPRRRP